MITGRRAGATARAAFLAGALAGCGDGDPLAEFPPIAPALQLDTGGLDRPVFATAPPGDTERVFVVEQTGRIRIVRAESLLTAPFLDVSALVSCCGERGLLGLAFHPQYATNGRFYVNYTDTAGDTRVVRYQVSAEADVADPATASVVLGQTQPFSNHNGGMLAFGPDGYLYVGLGDGGSGGDPQGNGQSLTTLLGKLLRLDVDGAAPYAVPVSNPFVGQTSALPEIWAFGLRNPWRFSFDRATGDLYVGDVGQNAFEEINVQPGGSLGGENYGWNVMEGPSCYNATSCTQTGLKLPVLDYGRGDGCSVTGGYVYRGSRVTALLGLYLYSDYCGGWIRSFRYAGNAATDRREWPALAPGGLVSSFGEDGRGELYVVAYGTAGALYRIVPATP